jgi:hypothetical protein
MSSLLCLQSSLIVSFIYSCFSLLPALAGPTNTISAKLFKVNTAADPGTAFVIGPAENGRCVLLTALHVIRVNASDEPLLFQSPSGSLLKLKNTVFTGDPDLDIAFVPVSSCNESIALPLARATSIEVSQKVVVMGYPADKEPVQGLKPIPSVVTGRITQYNDTSGYDLNYDAATKPGYSGGPVISDQGRALLAMHGFSDTVNNLQDPSQREKLRVGGRGVSSALIHIFLKRHGYLMSRTQVATCLVGICQIP